jgi:hypothetical protein
MYTGGGIDVTWVEEAIFAGGGEHLPAAWEDFAGQTGVSGVVHLRPASPAAFRGSPPARFLWLSVREESDASDEERLLAGTFVSQCLAEGRRVLLHSSLGRHRTRWVYVAYRILAGSSVRAALRRASQRPWMEPYTTDERAWSAFAAHARAARRNPEVVSIEAWKP